MKTTDFIQSPPHLQMSALRFRDVGGQGCCPHPPLLLVAMPQGGEGMDKPRDQSLKPCSPSSLHGVCEPSWRFNELRIYKRESVLPAHRPPLTGGCSEGSPGGRAVPRCCTAEPALPTPVVHVPEELQVGLVHHVPNLLPVALHQLCVVHQLLLCPGGQTGQAGCMEGSRQMGMWAQRGSCRGHCQSRLCGMAGGGPQEGRGSSTELWEEASPMCPSDASA